MGDHSLVWPMFAMVLLTVSVLGRLFRARVSAVKGGAVSADYFRIYQGGAEPESSAKLARSFSNQFEAPVLFYVGCVTAMVTGAADNALVVLAWLYVAFRVAHVYVHTGSNRLRPRVRTYFGSWVVLVIMWAVIAYRAL